MITLLPGIACVIFVAICYLKEYFGCSSYEANVETVLSIDNEKRVVPIDRFRFSEDLYRTVSSVHSENKAYKAMWEDAFTYRVGQGEKEKAFIKEFLECQYIYWMSLELNSYFVSINSPATEIIGREQMPDILIKNRVIELISKPYKEREKFQSKIQDKDTEGQIVYMGGEDDVIFDMLEIELPKKSKVIRDGNALVIKNRNFDIRFESDFDGFGIVLPRYFEEFYMNRSLDNTQNYKIGLKMSIRLKPYIFFSIRDWKYLGWLDQIGEKFVDYFSFDEFVKKVGYEHAATEHLLFLNGLKKRYNKEVGKYDDLRIVKIEEKKG